MIEKILENKKYLLVGGFIVFIVLVSSFSRGGHRDGHYGGQQNVISVTAQAEVSAVPDIASLVITLSKDADTANLASNELNSLTRNTLAYLKEQGIEDKDIKAEYGGVSPKYTTDNIPCLRFPCPTPETKITGYTATQSINIKIRNVDSANAIRTGLTAVGVDQIYGPTFVIDNEDALKEEARAKAIKLAREKAKTLARQLDVRLGKVTSFSENTNNYPMMYAKAAGMDMQVAEGVPELPKGENKITSMVTVTYQIK
jgi:uncharacterized protein YggE